MNNVVKIKGLVKTYINGNNVVKALDGIDLTINKGDFVAIVGTSGSGKSTLLNMIGGLDYPTSGEVIINGEKLSNLKNDKMTIFRRRNIGFVFQSFNLIPILNVHENIILPCQLSDEDLEKEYFDKIVTTLGLADKLDYLPNNLSGGQQQRVAIARALITNPSIILADEPTGNLDTKTSLEVIELIKTTCNRFNQSVVMITHNLEIAKKADRIIYIEDGKIVRED